MLLLAIVVREIPIISIPFKWLESYFHEISHGIAALITGGNIMRIQLFTNGAGLCTTLGGSTFLIAFAGYAGASIWGTLIYFFAGRTQRIAQVFSGFMMLLLASSILLWARDLLTLVILIVLLVMFFIAIKKHALPYLQKFMQLLGLIILLNSLLSPLYLLDGRHLGDGAALSGLTGIPEFIWIVCWTGLALFAVLFLRKSSVTHKKSTYN